MSRDEAGALLEQYYGIIHSCVTRGWNDYRKEYPAKFHAWHRPSTRASIVRDHIVEYARQEFENLAGVRAFVSRGYFLVSIAGKALLRFKKLGKGGRSRNYPTHQATEFADNTLPFPVGAVTSATRFDAGYQLNKLGTAITQILISCPQADGVLYTLEVAFDRSELPFPEIAPKQVPAKTKVRAKGIHKRAKANDVSPG